MTVHEKLVLGAKASKNSTIALVFIAALKGIVGFYSGSSALVADAIHTSLDIFTSFAVWVGLKFSMKDAEERFPYGYYKAENMVSLFVSIIILFSGLILVRDALKNITNPIEIELQGIALGTAIFSVLAMYALSQYKIKIGRKINSQALIADAMHSYTDAFTSIIVVVSIAGSMFGFPWFDSVGVLIISLIIFKLGISIARESALTLMDSWQDKEALIRIRQNVDNIQGVKVVEDIRLRKSGLVVFGEIVVETEGDTNLKRVEMLSEEIEKTVKKEVTNLEHLVINAKPTKSTLMKIAIPVLADEGLQSRISPHFGKAPYYIIVDVESNIIKKWNVRENPAASFDKKVGVKTADFLKSMDVNTVVVRDIGEGPFLILRDSFIKMLQMPETVEYVENIVGMITELNVITSPTE